MSKKRFHFSAVKSLFLALLLSSLLISCQTAKLSGSNTAPAPVTTPTPDDNLNRPRSEPYAGDLSIFEDPKRAENLQIDRVMDLLQILAGKTVADIGAGSGWFSVRAAARAGKSGKVYAVEINQEYIDYINKRAQKEGLTNIQTVLGTEDDPQLPENSVDAALILKTYHEIGQPVKVMKKLRTALKGGALVGIIDRNGNGDDHGIKQETVEAEMDRAGYDIEGRYDFVKPDGMDYFLVFKTRPN